MYLSTEDARSDVILAGAMTVFGDLLLGLVLSAPFVPSRGIALAVVYLAAAFALSGLVPLLLARYRDDVPAAFGLDRGAIPWTAAAALAAPAVVVGIVRGYLVTADPAAALLGRAGAAGFGVPTVGAGSFDVVSVATGIVEALVYTVGTVLLLGFLTVRGRDAWRSDDRSANELLRVVGLGAAAAALVLGTVRTLTAGGSMLGVVLNVAAVLGVVLVADRAVPAGATVERGAVLTPVVLVAAANILAAGGLFGGGLLGGLYLGALATSLTVAIAVTIAHGRRTATVVPLLLAVHWWPASCLGPLPFATGAC